MLMCFFSPFDVLICALTLASGAAQSAGSEASGTLGGRLEALVRQFHLLLALSELGHNFPLPRDYPQKALFPTRTVTTSWACILNLEM